MRRLTLVLSDVYLPAEAEADERGRLPLTHQLEALQWLLRFSDRPQRIPDWRSWVLGETEPRPFDQSLAMYCARGVVPDAIPDSTWIATPVSLEARLDHVRLVDRGLLELDAEESARICSEFGETFGPSLALHANGPRGFVLTGMTSAPRRTMDPARLLGADIGPAIPGTEAPELRRLWTEMEMWLHASPLNVARERAGKRRVSALWLWGREAPEWLGPPPYPLQDPTDFGFVGRDPFVVENTRRWGWRPVSNPRHLDDLEGAAHAVVELTPLTGPAEETLPMLEKHWFAPARARLSEGRLEHLNLLINDRWFQIWPNRAWKFWRRRRHWLEALKA